MGEIFMHKWLTRDVLLISLSAFFADAGYQALIAGFPIFLVIYLKAPAYMLGIAMALAYGIGSLFAYAGGRLADRYGKKRIAILGNLLIPILSFTGFSSTPAEATALFSTGWWARNFRTPARRAMIGDISSRLDKGKVYGFLNALDVGGGIIAVAYLSVGIYMGIALRLLFLVTIVPLLISSLCLALVRYKGLAKNSSSSKINEKAKSPAFAASKGKTYRSVLIATALFGLSFYSMSFPVLTIAQQSTSLYGVASYALFLLLSAVFGYVSGAVVKKRVSGLALYGYMLAGIGSLVIGLSYYLGIGAIGSYLGVALMGIALGSIETLEPTIISLVKSKLHSGSGMGALTASRSIGLFFANLVLGALYTLGPLYAYSFAAFMAMLAGIVLLSARSGL
ncbi:MAG: MFS transporter [Candidatus Marsarchaeota archaeon]|nr:MFS transporter [Candidatus Marsarchaeota archaeon]MCL5418558.1 MFS transporter [Candidatus Marsarchaeota archaeon]